MSATSGARSRRAIEATASTINTGGRSSCSTTVRRDAATGFIRCSERFAKDDRKGGSQRRSPRGFLSADLEIQGSRKSVGHRRPFFHVGHQRIDLAWRDALALHIDLAPHIGKTDRLLADVTGAPDCRDVEVTLELKLELVDDPAAMHGIGVQTDRKARTEGSQRGLGRIGRGVVA